MPQQVEVTGFGIVEFPDEATPEQIRQGIQDHVAPLVLQRRRITRGQQAATEPQVDPTLSALTSTARRMVADPLVSAAKGVVGLPEALVGIADIPTLGGAGKLAEKAGVDFKGTQDILGGLLSPEQKAANAQVQAAKGFLPTAQAALENPSTIAHGVIESLPAMFGGGAIARKGLQAVSKLGPKGAAIAAGGAGAATAGAVGEGAITAGQIAEGIRQKNEDKGLTWQQAGAALAAGTGTGLIGAASGRLATSNLAKKLGLDIADVETRMAAGKSLAEKQVLLKNILAGAITEGVVEELPQSAQEQVFQNLAAGKPWNDGVAEAAATGMLAGMAMGAGANAKLPAPTVPKTGTIETPAEITPDKLAELKAALEGNRLKPEPKPEPEAAPQRSPTIRLQAVTPDGPGAEIQIVPLTEQVFDTYLKRRNPVIQSLAEYQEAYPDDTHLRLVKGPADEKFRAGTTGTLNTLVPPGIGKDWKEITTADPISPLPAAAQTPPEASPARAVDVSPALVPAEARPAAPQKQAMPAEVRRGPLSAAKEPWQMTRKELLKNNLEQPPSGVMADQVNRPPVGAWRMDAYTGELERLESFDPHKLETKEPEGDVKNTKRYLEYVDAAKRGLRAPPITVVDADGGKLQGSGRRRIMAAREAGVNVEGWRYKKLGETHSAQTHKQSVEQALREGKPVPAAVLADYPDLKPAERAQPVPPAGAALPPELTSPKPAPTVSPAGPGTVTAGTAPTGTQAGGEAPTSLKPAMEQAGAAESGASPDRSPANPFPAGRQTLGRGASRVTNGKHKRSTTTEDDGLLHELASRGLKLPFFRPDTFTRRSFNKLAQMARRNEPMTREQKDKLARFKSIFPRGYEDNFGADGEVLEAAYKAAQRAGLATELFREQAGKVGGEWDTELDALTDATGKSYTLREILESIPNLAEAHIARKGGAAQAAEGAHYEAQHKADVAFQREQNRPGNGTVLVPPDDIKQGMSYTLNDVKLRITDIEFDDDGRVTGVTLDDGAEYMTQHITAEDGSEVPALRMDEGSLKGGKSKVQGPKPNEGEVLEPGGGYGKDAISPLTLEERERSKESDARRAGQQEFSFIAKRVLAYDAAGTTGGGGAVGGQPGGQQRPSPVAGGHHLGLEGSVNSLRATKLLARTISEDLIRFGGTDILGKEVHSPYDLALLAQTFRHPQFEVAHWIFTRQGQVVGRYAVSLRAVGATRVLMPKDSPATMREMMQALGADEFWLLHNHPTADVTPSDSDIRTTVQVALHVDGFQGHVVINHLRFALVNKLGQVAVLDLKDRGVIRDPLRLPLTEASAAFQKVRVSTPEEFAALAKRMQAHVTEGAVALFYLDNKGKTVALGEAPASAFTSFTDLHDAMGEIEDVMQHQGAVMVAAYYNGPQGIFDQMEGVAQRLVAGDKLADFVHDRDGKVKSLREVQGREWRYRSPRNEPERFAETGAEYRAGVNRELNALLEKPQRTPTENARITELQNQLGQQDLFPVETRDPKAIEAEQQAREDKAELERRRTARLRGDAIETQDNLFGERQEDKRGQGMFFEPEGKYGRAVSELGFYDTMLEALKAWQGKGTPEQLMAHLGKTRGALEQAAWIGLDGFLKGKTTVTRAEVEQFTRDNAVEVREVVKGDEAQRLQRERKEVEDAINASPIVSEAMRLGMSQLDAANLPWRLRDGRANINELPDQLQPTARAFMQDSDRLRRLPARRKEEETKFSRWQFPGGENYREMLLTLPSHRAISTPSLSMEESGELGTLAGEMRRDGNLPGPKMARWRELFDKATRYKEAVEAARTTDGEFTSSHFDEPNLLAHVRFNERTDAQGNRVLFIEEVQSDWHLEGRKQGYRPEKEAQLNSLVEKRDRAKERRATVVREAQSRGLSYSEAVALDTAIEADTTAIDAQREINALGRGDVGVPDAPFKGTWPMLVMKRMLRWAAEHNFDSVAWITGDQTADRYDLSKQVDAINVSRGGGKTWEIWADKDGRQAINRNVETLAEVEAIIGKELTAKVADMAPGDAAKTFSGLDLKIGGEWARALYDRTLPNEVNKFVKKWGGRVERAAFGDFEDGHYLLDHPNYVTRREHSRRKAEAFMAEHPGWTMRPDPLHRKTTPAFEAHSLTLTPAMKDAALGGLPLFEEGAGYGSNPKNEIVNLTGDEHAPKEFGPGQYWLAPNGRLYRVKSHENGADLILREHLKVERDDSSYGYAVSQLISHGWARVTGLAPLFSEIYVEANALSPSQRNQLVSLGIEKSWSVEWDRRNMRAAQTLYDFRAPELREEGTGYGAKKDWQKILKRRDAAGTQAFALAAQVEKLKADGKLVPASLLGKQAELIADFQEATFELLRNPDWAAGIVARQEALQKKLDAGTALTVDEHAELGQIEGLLESKEGTADTTLRGLIESARARRSEAAAARDLGGLNQRQLKERAEKADENATRLDAEITAIRARGESATKAQLSQLAEFKRQAEQAYRRLGQDRQWVLSKLKDWQAAKDEWDGLDNKRRVLEAKGEELTKAEDARLADLGVDLRMDTDEKGVRSVFQRGIADGVWQQVGFGAGIFRATEQEPGVRSQKAELPEATVPTTPASADVAMATATTLAGNDTPRGFWDSFKGWLRKFASPTPEIPLFGPAARWSLPMEKFLNAIKQAGSTAPHDAEAKVKHVLEPLMALPRADLDPNTFQRHLAVARRIQFIEKQREAKANALRAEIAAMEQTRANREAIDERREALAELDGTPDPRVVKLEAELKATTAELATNPQMLFKNAVLYRDFISRYELLQPKQKGHFKFPGGLTIEQIVTENARTNAAIAASPHRAAIEEALDRHYKLMAEMEGELLKRGHLIPEDMRNGSYFPHQVLDYTTQHLDRIRPGTENPFRGYLRDPKGSTKAIETDYVQAIYRHVAEVLAHNIHQDAVETHIKPLDISDEVRSRVEAMAHAEGRSVGAFEWRSPDNLPPGYVFFDATKKLPLAPGLLLDPQTLAKALGVVLQDGDVIEQMRKLGVDVTVTPDMLQQALVAGERQPWVIPKPVAEALDGLLTREEAKAAREKTLLGHYSAKAVRLWKLDTLFAPWHYIRYEFNNSTSDIVDKWFGADPGMGRYLARAGKEARAFYDGAEATPELRAAFEQRVLDSVTFSEVGKVASAPGFRALQSDRQQLGARLTGAATTTLSLSRLREATFRYAKFLADLERIKAGKPPVYAGAYWRDVEAQDTPEAKAGYISRKTFGDYGMMSPAGERLRDQLVPFHSWTEINFRYHANLFRNLADFIRLREFGPGMNAARAGAISIALRLAVAYGIVHLWNNIGGKMAGAWDDDDDLEATLSAADRRRFHIILGRDARGQTKVLYLASALGDVMSWLGGDNLARLTGEWMRGDIGFAQLAGDWAKQFPADLMNKVAQSTGPTGKAAFITVSGKQPFPDVTNMRSVSGKQKWLAVAETMTDREAVDVLRRAFDNDYYPRPSGEVLQQLVLQVRRRDPEQWAYYEVKQKVADWKEQKTGKRFEAGDYTAPEAEALRNFRRAVYLGDVDAAQRFYTKLLGYGYTAERLKASVQHQNPLAELAEKDRPEFVRSLSRAEREELRRALQYWERMGTLKGSEKGLFPTKDQKHFTPQPGRLQGAMERFDRKSDEEVRRQAERMVEAALTGRK